MGADTIAAIATAPGRAGIGIVRVAGKLAPAIAQAITGKALRPRLATFTEFRDTHGALIDEGVAILFAAPHSYTGEDTLELQGHGGDAVLRLVLETCLAHGALLAQPGEFTQRAFLNGKLDLAQAESVADLIEASSSEAVRSAARSLSGAFSEKVKGVAQAFIDLRMFVEATLDFPDEDVEFVSAHGVADKIAQLRAQLEAVLATAQQGNVLRQGLRVVLLGQPNVGKSSLLNRLAGEELAIVTPIAGTTRDSVRSQIHLDGVPLHLVDTAGLRPTEDPVEKIGIERSWQEARQADVAILVVDARDGVTAQDEAILEQLPRELPRMIVRNKVDLLITSPEYTGEHQTIYDVSAKTGTGIDALKQTLLRQVGWQATGEGVFMARERHLVALKQSLAHAHEAQQHALSGASLELLAEELRLAHQALATITGEFTPDDLLGEIFARFCIGK